MIRPAGRTVIMDATFFDALLVVDHARHGEAIERYEQLVADYESGSTVLVTHEAALAGTTNPERAGTIARICEVARIDSEVRDAIRRIRTGPHAGFVANFDDGRLATLVLFVRRKIDELVSFDDELRDLAIPTLRS